MKKRFYPIAVLVLAMSYGARAAEQLDVDYSSFYSHVKKLDNEETNRLRFAFGFKHIAKGRLCEIEQAAIVTQKQTQALIVENGQRFTVPTDKVLKMARAIVSITLADQANQCDMSVQLETKPEQLKSSYTHAELAILLEQYRAFFSNMGGLFSFMMPSVEGLVLQFEQSSVLPPNLVEKQDEAGNITLDENWFAQNKDLTLPSAPIRITALVEK
jgi:hypothetical protein